jgi:hypothetical protein
MTAINLSTQRRLKQLPQIPCVWEGDRRQVDSLAEELELEDDDLRELIIWVDGVEGVVRSMQVVNHTMGVEAIVRALIEAMEYPQAPAQPARPQKIIVRDRQLQFYLRGVLQNLEIIVDYVPELPIVDELFHRFSDMAGTRAPKLQRKYQNLLDASATEIWKLAPWEILADYEAIEIELNEWDIEKFYLSVMGMLGMEYGILLYRSVESLQRFRAMALERDGTQDMESAFLSQDCIFMTFDALNPEIEINLGNLPAKAVSPNFGNIHPMEGMRPFLYEEEAIATQVALSAFKEFVRAFRKQLAAEDLPSLTKSIGILTPDTNTIKQIVVTTLPELSEELLQMHLAMENHHNEDFDGGGLPIQDDLIPDDSYISLGVMPWDRVATIRLKATYHQNSDVQPVGEGLPILLVQTTRPKAAEMIERIQQAGGLQGICFNGGEDLDTDVSYDLGILQLGDGEMQLFGEFYHDSEVHIEARKKWEQRSESTQGYCGLVIAKGLTGKARGNPGVEEMVAFLETKSLSDADLGLGTLQLMADFDDDE